jgi:hypothetical protein
VQTRTTAAVTVPRAGTTVQRVSAFVPAQAGASGPAALTTTSSASAFGTAAAATTARAVTPTTGLTGAALTPPGATGVSGSGGVTFDPLPRGGFEEEPVQPLVEKTDTRNYRPEAPQAEKGTEQAPPQQAPPKGREVEVDPNWQPPILPWPVVMAEPPALDVLGGVPVEAPAATSVAVNVPDAAMLGLAAVFGYYYRPAATPEERERRRRSAI